jgi:large subunit ribosomal protein L4
VLSKSNHKKALIVIDGKNTNLELAVRNLKDYKVIDARGLNVYDVLDYDGLYITKSAFEKVEAMVQ